MRVFVITSVLLVALLGIDATAAKPRDRRARKQPAATAAQPAARPPAPPPPPEERGTPLLPEDQESDAAPPPPPAVDPTAELRARAGTAIQRGRLEEAAALLGALIEDHPKDVALLELLTEVLLLRDMLPQAAVVAERRLALKDDAAWRRKLFFIVRFLDDHKEAAVAGCPQLVKDFPDDFEVVLGCAQLLSWTKGRQEEARELYRQATELSPEDKDAAFGLAQTLSWTGHIDEARQVFDALLKRHPDNAPAWIGRAQVERWNGAPAKARPFAAQAVATAPDSAAAHSELAAVEHDLGDRAAARSAARRALTLDPGDAQAQEILAKIQKSTPLTAEVTGTWYAETPTDLNRYNAGARVGFFPLPDTKLSISTLATRFTQFGASLDRIGLGIEAEQRLAGLFSVRADYMANILPADMGVQHVGGASVGITAPLTLRAGVRHRLLVDLPVDRTLVTPLEGVSSGGLPLFVIQQGLALTEGFVSAAYSPLRGSYLYANGDFGYVHDALPGGRAQVAAGGGLDVLGLFIRDFPLQTTVKYNYFLLHYTNSAPLYFSPSFFQVHSPGLELRVSLGDWLIIGAEALGALRVGAPVGWIGAGFARLRLSDHFQLEGRVNRLDDTNFQSIGAGVVLQATF
jgi:tetratricopeptide (TPR) repeat protein